MCLKGVAREMRLRRHHLALIFVRIGRTSVRRDRTVVRRDRTNGKNVLWRDTHPVPPLQFVETGAGKIGDTGGIANLTAAEGQGENSLIGTVAMDCPGKKFLDFRLLMLADHIHFPYPRQHFGSV